MHILITGGTGLIGRALCCFWLQQGHQLTVWSRSPEKVASLCGEGVRGIARLEDCPPGALDAVVNLAGAPIADRPWTKARRKLLRDSRIALTGQLVSWLAGLDNKPAVLISGSAVGWYGDGGDLELTEQSGPVNGDFASQLCQDWENAALQAEPLGIRVVLVRTGLVLTADGGFLKRLLLPFKLGLGGPIGDGRQWMPWIHLQDQVTLIDFLLHHEAASGPYNATAPTPVRNSEFAKALGKALQRTAFMPLPGVFLKLGLGDLARLLLGGQQVVPERLLEAGFVFRFNRLDAALADLL
jgi:uncharacterized protein (TIGR01777 family)